MRLIVAAALVTCLTVSLVGCENSESPQTSPQSDTTKLKGKTGEWLSDRRIALMVKSCEKAPGYNPSSAVDFYAVTLLAKNLSSHAQTISRIQVEFNASDLKEATEAVLGPANLKPGERFPPHSNIIGFRSSNGSSRDLSLAPGETREFQIHGHFWFAKKDYALAITVFRQQQPISGPFVVEGLR